MQKTTEPKLTKALAVMERAAIAAGNMLLELQPRSRRLLSRKDFLTDADLKSEEVILRTLASEYPDIPAFSEEEGGTASEETKGRMWIIDPIDGTINFFLQDDHWSVSIALIEDKRTVAGVIYLPSYKQLFSATSEGEAVCRLADKKTEPCRVNKDVSLADSQFWVEWGKEAHEGDDHKKVQRILAKLDRHTLYPQIRNSITASMVNVARGNIAGCILPKPEPFDIAAAGLIVERAGGTVTDMSGALWTPFSRSLVATNGELHDDVLDIVREAC